MVEYNLPLPIWLDRLGAKNAKYRVITGSLTNENVDIELEGNLGGLGHMTGKLESDFGLKLSS